MSYYFDPNEFVLKSAEGETEENIVTKALADLQKSVDDRLKAVETKAADIDAGKLTARLDKLETKLARPAVITGNSAGNVERKAFDTMLRRGELRMSADEVKTLTVASDAAGGYLAPDEIGSELIKLLRVFSPIRQYARVVSIGGDVIKYPRRASSTSATWVSEIAARTSSEMSFEQVAITPFELATYTDLSNQLLEDNAYNLEGELLADFAESFGKAEGAAFVGGTGTGQPKGLLSASGITEVKTGVAAAFPTTNPADVLIGMFHKLPGVHAQNAVWMMNRTTLGALRTWKDGQGRYLVIDPIADGAATTLLGRPIVEVVDMPDIAANAYPIVFGDLQGYRIVDRVGFTTLRDPYTLANVGQTRFHARKRVGADITHPDRFVKLKVSA
jgi:HK97 family phage major capsid protein